MVLCQTAHVILEDVIFSAGHPSAAVYMVCKLSFLYSQSSDGICKEVYSEFQSRHFAHNHLLSTMADTMTTTVCTLRCNDMAFFLVN